jgi:hypothetical protein
MSTDTDTSAKNELQIAIERMQKGIRDPERAKKALENLDRVREELRGRIGTVEIAVELVREFRDR